MRQITLDEVKEMVCNDDDSFVGCVISQEEMKGFFDNEDGTFESGDWFECEGGQELVVDKNGVCLYYNGYYSGVGPYPRD